MPSTINLHFPLSYRFLIPMRPALRVMSQSNKSLFYAFCPDYTDADVLVRRLNVRGKHFERVEQDKAAGIFEFGRGILPPPESKLHDHPALDKTNNQQAMNGSMMFLRMDDLQDAWKRIKEDVYWTEGVWDKGKVQVGQFIRGPNEE